MGGWKAVDLPSCLGRSVLPERGPWDLLGCLRASCPPAFLPLPLLLYGAFPQGLQGKELGSS